MAGPFITLLTDFGARDPSAGILHGVDPRDRAGRPDRRHQPRGPQVRHPRRRAAAVVRAAVPAGRRPRRGRRPGRRDGPPAGRDRDRPRRHPGRAGQRAALGGRGRLGGIAGGPRPRGRGVPPAGRQHELPRPRHLRPGGGPPRHAASRSRRWVRRSTRRHSSRRRSPSPTLGDGALRTDDRLRRHVRQREAGRARGPTSNGRSGRSPPGRSARGDDRGRGRRDRRCRGRRRSAMSALGEPLLYEDSYGRLCLAVNQGDAGRDARARRGPAGRPRALTGLGARAAGDRRGRIHSAASCTPVETSAPAHEPHRPCAAAAVLARCRPRVRVGGVTSPPRPSPQRRRAVRRRRRRAARRAPAPSAPAADACAKDSPRHEDRRQADDRHRQPGLPAVLPAARSAATPSRGTGRATRPTARASRARSPTPSPTSSASPRTRSPGSSCRSTTAYRARARRTSTSTSTRSRTRPSAPRPSTCPTATTTATRRSSSPRTAPFAKATTVAGLKDAKLGRAGRHDEPRRDRERDQADDRRPSVYDTNDAAIAGARGEADRRHRRRPPDGVLHDRRSRLGQP